MTFCSYYDMHVTISLHNYNSDGYFYLHIPHLLNISQCLRGSEIFFHSLSTSMESLTSLGSICTRPHDISDVTKRRHRCADVSIPFYRAFERLGKPLLLIHFSGVFWLICIFGAVSLSFSSCLPRRSRDSSGVRISTPRCPSPISTGFVSGIGPQCGQLSQLPTYESEDSQGTGGEDVSCQGEK